MRSGFLALRGNQDGKGFAMHPPDQMPIRLGPHDPNLRIVLDLIQRSFAYMTGRIDPPSSADRLTLEDIAIQAQKGEVWVIGETPVACMFLTERTGVLYVGKLATDAKLRGTGLARRLIDVAKLRAVALGLSRLELESRVELTENHACFLALGFEQIGTSAHPGYDRPTSIIMALDISANA